MENGGVREDDALRRPRRARRVEDDGGVLAAELGVRGRPTALVDARQVVHGEAAGKLGRRSLARLVAVHDHVLELRQPVRHGGEMREERLVEHERACIGVVDDVPQGRPARGGVDRDLDETGLLEPEPRVHVLDAVQHHQRDVLARVEAELREARGRSIRDLVELGVGPRHPADLDRDLVASDPGPLPDPVGERLRRIRRECEARSLGQARIPPFRWTDAEPSLQALLASTKRLVEEDARVDVVDPRHPEERERPVDVPGQHVEHARDALLGRRRRGP